MRHPRAWPMRDASHDPGRPAGTKPAWVLRPSRSGRRERDKRSDAAWRAVGALVALRMMRPGPMRVVRPVRPGPLWRNPGHALLGAPPLAFGGSEKSGRRANPRAQAKQQGPMTLAFEQFGL